MMKILIVSEDVPHPSMGGLGQHAVTLAKALARQGHQVDFMGNGRHAYDPIIGLPGRFFAELRWRFGGWKETGLGFYNPLRRLVIARALARAILTRAGNYDVIHYHGHAPDVAAFIPSTINFVQSRHDQGADCLSHTRFRNGAICNETSPRACAGCISDNPNFIQTALSAMAVRHYRARVVEAFRRHKTIFVSDMLRRNLTRTAGPGDWGVVVHNFIDLGAVESAANNPFRLLPGDPELLVVAVAGKLYPPKGVDKFLEEIAPRLDKATRVVILGDGPQESALRSRFTGAQITFMGWRERGKALELLAGADLIVVPSVCEESCATTIFEGLTLGKLVFALDRGGTPELGQYAMFPGQLQVFPDMASLTAGVLASRPYPNQSGYSPSKWNADVAASRIVDIYRMPCKKLGTGTTP